MPTLMIAAKKPKINNAPFCERIEPRKFDKSFGVQYIYGLVRFIFAMKINILCLRLYSNYYCIFAIRKIY